MKFPLKVKQVERDCLYLRRSMGERGIIYLEFCYKASTIAMIKYLYSEEVWMLQLVYKNERSRKLHSSAKEACKFAKELCMHRSLGEKPETTIPQKVKYIERIAKKNKKK